MAKLFKDQFPFHPRTTNGNYIHANEVSVLKLSVLSISQSCFNIYNAAVLRTVVKFCIRNKEKSTIVLEF